MKNRLFRIRAQTLIVFGMVSFRCLNLTAQSLAPGDVGTTVSGFQDDFDGSTLGANWVVRGASVFSVGGGLLHVASATGDPNHLLYEAPGYDGSTQEVLLRIRIASFGSGDGVRGGAAVGVDPASSQGINYHFRNASDGQASIHMAFLNDAIVWGPVQNFVWQANTWYWMRLRQEPDAAAQGGLNDVFAKLWPADGTVAEPTGWQLLWDYASVGTVRAGFAGIAASSSGGLLDFDVDYALIKAAGLPSIVVAPRVAVQTPVAINQQPVSLSVNELAPASFTAGVVGNPAPTVQWYRNNNAIPGATNATYSLDAAAMSNNNASFKLVAANVVSNLNYTATSSNATLTVIADTTRPVLLGAQSLGLSQVQIRLSEPITLATGTNLANYSIAGTNGPLAIFNATPDSSQSNIVLSVGAMIDGALYVVTVNNLADPSAAGNVIAPNSKTNFIGSDYTLLAVGNPTPAGNQVPAGNGFNIAGGGADLGGVNDQFQFSYQLRSGDFDFKVRLDSLSLADAWAEAGLVVRENLTAGARSAGVLATPSISGAYFQSRSTAGGVTALAGSFPVNYPNTWLRLKRVGDVFTGYAGFDGQNWTQLGTASLALPAGIYLGFAVSSHNTNQLTTAAFRDFGVVTGAGSNPPLALEPLGQSSRRTSLVISEIMYHPADTLGTINTNALGFVTNSLEFVEIFNTRGEFQDLSGFQLGGNISYTFPAGTVIPGGGFVVVARSPADLESVYGITGVRGPFTNNLPNNNGTVLLINQGGGVLLDIHYDSASPWPVAADGAGHSLVLARPSYGENNPQAWSVSDSIGGSPGRLDPVALDPLRNVVINEFLAHTDDPEVDYIELYNHSTQPVDVTGCVLTDDPTTNKFVLPAGPPIPAHGFVYYTQTNMNFSLGAEGETIYLKNPTRTRVLDAVKFGGQENGVATGRYPDGADQFYRLNAKTPGATNAGIRVSQIVINELMYAPLSLNADDQYVELYNRGGSSVNLGGWQLSDAIGFTFPSNTVLAADGYLVIAKNAAHLRTNYANLTFANTLGDFSGKLSSSGERLVLTMPDTVAATNSLGVVVTNLIHIAVDEVTYGAGGRWPQWANGGGSSLELIDPHSDHRLPSNWADSDETHKAPWTLVSATGTIDNGSTTADELQVLLPAAGECLIDNVQVLDGSGINLIANTNFESGVTGWTAEGTESLSGLESSEGYNSTKSYHVRAVDRGDNQVNRIRTLLTSALASGTANVTIRAAVRWLKGPPQILLRLRGNWLECAGEMALPVSPGTPGARNSRYAPNAAPAIVEVQHSPVLPAAAQPFVVSARVTDPDGLASVALKYRLDPAATYTTLAMADNGAGGDAVAGDGVFSAIIPGQTAGALIAFYVQATDKYSTAATSVYPNDAPARECLVRIGEVQPTGNFPVYRLWMTQATLNNWTSRNKLDNSPLNVTFVLGNQRVIHNTQALYAGSPYIAPGYSSPTTTRCGYSITMPADDGFLGEQDLVLDWPGGHGSESSAMQEQMGYWIADRMNLPFSHRYIIRLHVNGATDDARNQIFEAVMQPAGSYLKEWSPGASSGQFFKVDRAFEFNDGGGLIADPQPRLQNYTTTGGSKKREAYRWNWNYRSADRVNDYTNIFALVDAVNATGPEPYTAATLGLVDMEEWMGILATEHIIQNFDAYGHIIGKNMYAFLPDGGKWQLYMFDLDWLMLAAANSGFSSSSAQLFNADDPTIVRMFAHPPFARAYWRTVEAAVNGPLNATNCNPVMDAKYQSLLANGVAWCDGAALNPPTPVKTWFSQRRTFLQSQLATVAAPFTVNPSVVVSNNVGIVTGTAPVGVATVWIDGSAWPVTWTSVTGWTAQVPLKPGSNALSVVGVDVHGLPVPGATGNLNVVYNGPAPSPVGQVVINEIMYHPAAPGGEYVELYNTSSNYTFDVSGWQINGLSYVFPAGSFIAPNGFLTLAANRPAFAAAYGATTALFDTFGGTLKNNGETFTLIRPGTNSASDQVVTKVRYDSAAPWPALAGSSLQLLDPRQDNWRVGNWAAAAATNPGLASAQWVFVTTNIPASSSTLYIYLGSVGDIYVDDLSLVASSGPNLLVNGDFESSLTGNWNLTANFTGSGVSPAVKHSGASSLHVVATAAGSGSGNALYQDITPALTIGASYTLSFWYLQSTNGGPLTVRLSLSGNPATVNPAPALLSSQLALTPSQTNSVLTAIPPFPPLWINELQAENLTGITNSAGQRTAWVELYNPSTSVVSLSGLYLANSYANLTSWAFPAGASINPGAFKVIFTDGQSGLSTLSELHTTFTLPVGGGNLALSRIYNGQPQVLDYVNYTNLLANRSYGSFPDGQSFARQEFQYVTPGSTNNGTSAPLTVSINEWMADNTRTLYNPIGSQPDDWFELFNYGPVSVDLTGYYLTDTVTNRTKFLIPAGYSIPPHGFLIVWADNKNPTGSGNLHVNFKLSKNGSDIGLFGSDGNPVDFVSFGPQTTDVSAGRFPDAGSINPLNAPTPGTNNVGANTPPTLLPIGDQTVTLGQTLSFTATATDSDQPTQLLTFYLGAGAPANANVDPFSGQFTWTPTQAPTTNLLTLSVADNGVPSLSATQSFLVTVYLPPTISVQMNGNQMQLTWPRGTLQEADEVTGPYLDMTQISPWTVNLSASKKFYRIRL